MTHLDLERGAAGDLRARALLDDGRERRARRRSSPATSSGSQERLEDGGYDGDVLLLHSGGGVMTPKPAEQFAVRLAASGIAAGAIASRHIATLCGYANAIGLDMGGTSTDISLVYDGEVRIDEGVVRRVRLPDLLPVDRGADDRRRRRLAGVDRRGRLAAQRPAVGRREPRARPATAAAASEPTNTDANLVLGRLGARADRRRDDARPRRRRAARSRTQVAEPLGLELLEAADAVIAGREREHGRRRPADLDPARLRPARVRARRLRRRRRRCTAPRSRASSSIPTVLVPPQPGHHVGARLPARRRPPRPLGDVPAPHVDDASTRTSSRREFAQARGRGARAARGRGRARRSRCRSQRLDRHALPRPVALARRSRSRRRSTSTQAVAHVPRRARARVQLPPRRRAGRDLPAQRHARSASTPKPELAAARADRRRRRSRRARAGPYVRRSRRRRSTRPSTLRDDLPAGLRVRGPGDRRPARLDDARPAGLARRGRRVAEHPHARLGGRATERRQAPSARLDPGHVRGAEERVRRPSSTRWPSRSCAPATRS